LKNLKVSEGTAGDADVTVVVKDDALADYGAKKITLDEAKANGDFKASGNQELIVKLAEVLRSLASS
jgi:alkyl sulfatase BDS1-like metallo-beta-lactamase superfamily hydrolase